MCGKGNHIIYIGTLTYNNGTKYEGIFEENTLMKGKISKING